MRGKPSTRGLQGTRRRIIPAHAGQTTSGLPGSVTSSDHPRACGANVEMHASLGSHVGSSPRMRGKLREPLRVLHDIRIIPAHAGQTWVRSAPCSARSDHPRACGANVGRVHVHELQCGSSPRMRGKPAEVAGAWTATRIIPAHAGQTPQSMLRPATQPDHPRACGANQSGRVGFGRAGGSSPRMRGKPTACRRSAARMRIIPAHAGQTVSNSSRTSARSDHPRACGANPALSVMTAAPAGSSPRMRGKRAGHRLRPRPYRIIPAHAGQTRRRAGYAR